MARYYIHKVGHQEMGSINFVGDKPKRGRYFLISKKCLSFFPHVSSVVMNDKVIVTIIPMYENNKQQKVLCTMDYHNQKFADIEYVGKHPRNEIRLYMNNEIDPNKNYFVKGDLAVFEEIETADGRFYSLTRISASHPKYSTVLDLLYKYDKTYKSNAIVEAYFSFIDKPDTDNIDVIITDEAIDLIKEESDSLLKQYEDVEDDLDENEEDEDVLNENEDDEDNSMESAMGCSFFNSSLFHDLVMNAYNYKCAITGKVIRYNKGKVDLFNLEAAHIKPHAHQGTYLPCNGIALSRDLHFAFDKGFFTISDDLKVVVSEKLKDDWFYKEFNGKPLFVPKEPFFRPNPIFLKHHRDHVFETFKQIRKKEESKKETRNPIATQKYLFAAEPETRD